MKIDVEIYKDKMILKAEAKTLTVKPKEPYCSTRLLVGSFTNAVDCLKQGIKDIGANRFFSTAPVITIIPKDMIDGGLSEVEQRSFNELGLVAGAREVSIEGYKSTFNQNVKWIR